MEYLFCGRGDSIYAYENERSRKEKIYNKISQSHSSFGVLSEYVVFFENEQIFFDFQKT